MYSMNKLFLYFFKESNFLNNDLLSLHIIAKLNYYFMKTLLYTVNPLQCCYYYFSNSFLLFLLASQAWV